MLGGVGLDTVLRKGERQGSIRWALGAFGAIALVLALVWLFGRGNLPGYAARVRNDSFVWPVVSTAVGLAAFAALLVVERRFIGKRWSLGTLRWVTLGIGGRAAGVSNGISDR